MYHGSIFFEGKKLKKLFNKFAHICADFVHSSFGTFVDIEMSYPRCKQHLYKLVSFTSDSVS